MDGLMNQKGKGQDDYQTPPHIFEQLDNVFNFTVDIAASDTNNLVDLYYTKEENALTKRWMNERIFCNPPFSEKAKWIKKADHEIQKGNCPIVVMILPVLCMDSIAWHKYIENKYHYEILKGKISFINPETGKPQSGNNCGTVVVYFKKKIRSK